MLATALGHGCLAVPEQPIDKAKEMELELIRAVAKGDRKAFEQLFRLYHSRVFKFSIRMVRDQMLAEEVACDTLYAVWNSASNFREKSTVSSWILGIAYNRSLKCFNRDARHTNNRESAYQMDELVEQSPDANPEEVANDSMEISLLNQAMSALSTDHRAVLELIGLGYSVNEIATIVDCPENTVKTRTFHARRQLRAALQDQ